MRPHILNGGPGGFGSLVGVRRMSSTVTTPPIARCGCVLNSVGSKVAALTLPTIPQKAVCVALEYATFVRVNMPFTSVTAVRPANLTAAFGTGALFVEFTTLPVTVTCSGPTHRSPISVVAVSGGKVNIQVP